MGVNCGTTSSPSSPIYTAHLGGSQGQNVIQEWSITSTTVHVRWTVDTTTWWGGIFDVGVDGMTSGDAIAFWTTTATVSSQEKEERE
jgi:hypothetical protein